jgi:isopentenyl phosphate kinase
MRAVKLGGSILTNKGKGGKPTYRGRVAKRLAVEIAGARPKASTLVVHGGGSYGHPVAVRHGVGRKRLAAAAVPKAFSAVQQAMDPLRSNVLASLRRAGIAAVYVPASASAFSSREGLYWEVESLAAYAERGLVPVTGGDVLLDETLGLRILSGDEVLAHAAENVGLEHVVFATDTDGVRVNKALVETMTAVEAAKASRRTGKGADATGGMAGKLAQAARIAATGATVDVVNGNVPGQVAAALSGRAHAGTRIRG